jgi:hypothetical protein
LIDRSARAKRQKVRTTFAPAKSSVFIDPHVSLLRAESGRSVVCLSNSQIGKRRRASA